MTHSLIKHAFFASALAIAGLTIPQSPAQAAELKIVPGSAVILNPTNPNRNYYDAVVHAIAIAAEPDEAFTVQSLEIAFHQDGAPVLSKTIAVDRMVGETAGIGEMVGFGLGAMLNGQVLNADGLPGLFGRDITLADSANLSANEALLTGRHLFSLDFMAEEIVVTASVLMADGTQTTLRETLPVRRHQSAITYSSPLDGVWLMTAGASIQGHHRLNPGTEFAVDFFKLNENGDIREGGNERAENYFGYGAPVMAAADGEVVFAITDDVQDRLASLPLQGESRDAAGQRIRRQNFQRMAADFPRAVAGNLIVLRHEQDGQVEYSSYGHLATGSISLAIGDRVERGQTIGRVGDTGDTLTVHLHFQLNAGPDPFTSMSLPVVFEGLEDVNRGVDPLRFVRGGEE
ncbi:MAG: M23 family metallopeptidase [Maricaulis sp.]|nr:M23 family metallopeptidase [Maricaulis sp.]MDG2043420.1 M23 family metallopeptidase [Maricaulis sp.]